MEPLELLRVLLDPDRLAIIGAVAAGPGDAPEIAERAGCPVDEVPRTLGALVKGGLVGREGSRYTLRPEGWRAVARSLPRDPPAGPRVAFGMTADEARVLGPFFRGDRLVEIPSTHGKRLVVLERLALEFELGVRYAESEVNAILRRFHADHATLRRLLVDEGFLDRDAGVYWRSGGRMA